MGARQDSMARKPIGLDEKELVAHLCTLCPKVSSYYPSGNSLHNYA